MYLGAEAVNKFRVAAIKNQISQKYNEFKVLVLSIFN
jgi:hypothetical protein